MTHEQQEIVNNWAEEIEAGKIKVFLGVPSAGHPKIPFINSMMALVCSGLVTKFEIVPGLPVQSARTKIAIDFMASDCTHLLMIDDDMVFTTKDVVKLIEAKKEVVSGLYNRRSSNPRPIVYKHDEDAPGELVFTDYFGPELCEVTGTSLAFTLIERSVIDKLGREFRFGQGQIGEDMDFVLRCYKNNIKWFLEPTARIGHLYETEV